MSKRICYHPELVPTEWNQARPEPCEVNSCRCGQNWTCPVCGHGQGSWPHDCGISDEKHEESLELWGKLVDA